MTALYVVGAILASALIVYLFTVLLIPEKLQ